MTDERKKFKQPPPSPTASAVSPCPTKFQISRTPRHWKFAQHHPTTPFLHYEIDKVQERAARFVTGDITYETRRMIAILEQQTCKWESLKKGKDSRLIMHHKGLKGTASIPTEILVSPNWRTRNQHSLEFKSIGRD